MNNSGEDRSRQRFAGQLTAHRGRVFAWVMRRVGADRAVAEDVTQDCFVRVWETRLSNPPPPGALHSYLLTTARNLLRDRFRRRSTVAGANLEQIQSADAETPEARFLLRETVERLVTEAALMPFVLRETLRLRVEEGLEYPVIAAGMGCPVGTVKSRLNAARSRLRAALAAQETIHAPEILRTQAIRRQAGTPGSSITTKTYKEQKKMADVTETAKLREAVRAMEARLDALEGERGNGSGGIAVREKINELDPWDVSSRRLAAELKEKRHENGSAFALGLVHVITQSANHGTQGTALGIRTFESAADLPDDRQLAERMHRMRLLTTDMTIGRIFRHFFALRFGGKEMRASADELAEATGAGAETVRDLLKPFIADRTLLLFRDGEAGETYEWEGNDPAITTLLFAAT